MEDSTEAQKWQQHLTLLREQYVNLYNANAELQREYAVATAEKQEGGFVARLLATVASLYCQHRYSDISIKLIDQEIPAHKFVLSARSDFFSDAALVEKTILDWSSLNSAVALVLLKWIYTGKISQEHLTLDLMKAAAGFQLSDLVDQCERYLIGTVELKNCVGLYSAAEELGTLKLKEHCSSLISAHWEDLTGEDFKEMPGSLLYKLLQTKSKYPLHAAVRLMREDVVFLYLVEHNAELPKAVNVVDHKGEMALEVALKTRQPSLARTLVEHGADLNAKDARGLSLLHSAILKGDSYSSEFIIEQLENNGSVSKLCEAVKINESAKNAADLKQLEGCTALHLVAKHNTENMLAEIGRAHV